MSQWKLPLPKKHNNPIREIFQCEVVVIRHGMKHEGYYIAIFIFFLLNIPP